MVDGDAGGTPEGDGADDTLKADVAFVFFAGVPREHLDFPRGEFLSAKDDFFTRLGWAGFSTDALLGILEVQFEVATTPDVALFEIFDLDVGGLEFLFVDLQGQVLAAAFAFPSLWVLSKVGGVKVARGQVLATELESRVHGEGVGELGVDVGESVGFDGDVVEDEVSIGKHAADVSRVMGLVVEAGGLATEGG